MTTTNKATNEHTLTARNGRTVKFTDHADFILVWEPRGNRITNPRRMSRDDARREYADLRASGFERVA